MDTFYMEMSRGTLDMKRDIERTLRDYGATLKRKTGSHKYWELQNIITGETVVVGTFCKYDIQPHQDCLKDIINRTGIPLTEFYGKKSRKK
jgi:hypothetical protein